MLIAVIKTILTTLLVDQLLDLSQHKYFIINLTILRDILATYHLINQSILFSEVHPQFLIGLPTLMQLKMFTIHGQNVIVKFMQASKKQ